jgi:hypothetical protein
MWYLTTYQMRISFHVDTVDNFGIISQVEWHVKTRQKCQNVKMAKNNKRPNYASS